jgi:hypothetical protein
VGADRFSLSGEFGPQVCVHASDGIGDRKGAKSGEEVLDERTAARAGRSQDAMHELIDQQVGIDQDGHGLSAGPIESRAERTSAAKSSSG